MLKLTEEAKNIYASFYFALIFILKRITKFMSTKINFKNVMMIFLGSLIIALAFVCFIEPNDLAAGGVSGLSIILNKFFGWNTARTNLLLNIPLLILCFIFLGKEIFIKTVFAGLMIPLLIFLFDSLPTEISISATNNALLGAVFGGAVSGIGMGIIYKRDASSGGTGIIGHIINKYLGISISSALLVIDCSVVLLSLIAFDADTMMYSIISLVVAMQVMDIVMIGGKKMVCVQIVSEKEESIREEIYKKLDRGVTNINIESNFNKNYKHMLMCIIKSREFAKCKELVLSIDKNAFIVAIESSEVAGRGFTLNKEYYR